MAFTESLVRSERRSLLPSRRLENESMGTTESLRGTRNPRNRSSNPGRPVSIHLHLNF